MELETSKAKNTAPCQEMRQPAERVLCGTETSPGTGMFHMSTTVPEQDCGWLALVCGVLPWTGQGEKSGRKLSPCLLQMFTRGETQAGT